jgi:hypothetical protein
MGTPLLTDFAPAYIVKADRGPDPGPTQSRIVAAHPLGARKTFA